jgi:hypothetical protein
MRLISVDDRRQSSYGAPGESWCAEVESLRFLKCMAARFTNQPAAALSSVDLAAVLTVLPPLGDPILAAHHGWTSGDLA